MKLITFIRSEKLRYLLGGAFNAVFGYLTFMGVYYALLPLGVHYIFVVLISQAIAITCAFFNYRHYVFRSSGNAWGEYARFVSVYFVAVLLNTASMVALVDWIKLGVLTSQALSALLVVIVSFVSHRNYTFKTR